MTQICIQQKIYKFLKPKKGEQIFIIKENNNPKTIYFTRKCSPPNELVHVSSIREIIVFPVTKIGNAIEFEHLVGHEKYVFSIPSTLIKKQKGLQQIFDIKCEGDLVCYFRWWKMEMSIETKKILDELVNAKFTPPTKNHIQGRYVISQIKFPKDSAFKFHYEGIKGTMTKENLLSGSLFTNPNIKPFPCFYAIKPFWSPIKRGLGVRNQWGKCIMHFSYTIDQNVIKMKVHTIKKWLKSLFFDL